MIFFSFTSWTGNKDDPSLSLEIVHQIVQFTALKKKSQQQKWRQVHLGMSYFIRYIIIIITVTYVQKDTIFFLILMILFVNFFVN